MLNHFYSGIHKKILDFYINSFAAEISCIKFYCDLVWFIWNSDFNWLFEDKVICGFYPSLLCLSVCLGQTLLNYIIGEKIYFQKYKSGLFSWPDDGWR